MTSLESLGSQSLKIHLKSATSLVSPQCVANTRRARFCPQSYSSKMFQLRHATEPSATAIAAENADSYDLERIEAAFNAMVAAGTDNALFVEADLAFHKAIYLATHNEFFWPIGQLFSVALKEMFRIAALGSHRPRAIVEHGDVLRAILERKPEMARTAALTLLGNAASDIKLIRETARERG